MVHILTKWFSNVKCLRKKTANFFKLLWRSISALPRKGLNDVFSFPTFPSLWRGKQVAREVGVDPTCPAFIVCKSPIRISAWTFCIYTDIASGYPKTLQSNAGMIPQMGHNHFKSFRIDHQLTTCSLR